MIPNSSSVAIGIAVAGIVNRSWRSRMILMPHSANSPVNVNSKIAIDHGSTAPWARVLKNRAASKPIAIDCSNGQARLVLPRLASRCTRGLLHFSNVDVVNPDYAVGRRFVTEFGPLFNG